MKSSVTFIRSLPSLLNHSYEGNGYPSAAHEIDTLKNSYPLVNRLKEYVDVAHSDIRR